MDEEKLQFNQNSHENHPVDDKENLNNLSTKIKNKSAANPKKGDICEDLIKLSIDSEDGKTYMEKSPKPHIEMPITTRLRKRRSIVANQQDSDTTDSEREEGSRKVLKTVKRRQNKRSLVKSSYKDEKESKEIISSIGASKLKYDIKIDPNVVDRYTDNPVPCMEMPPPESPDTKRRRFEKENMVVARQSHLHPASSKYNQGPVVNPPLLSPGIMVGYTPAGQRHEVDLNFERPTWFKSEYARMQFDDATRINVTRMFHELETGRFLPDGLDPDVEKRYFAEIALASAIEHFEKFKDDPTVESAGSNTTAFEEHMSLLVTEMQLIELNKFAVVRLTDFSGEVASKLTSALTMNLTSFMIIKNPIIVETLEKFSTQSTYNDVIQPARALLDKVKKLFEVPKGQTFKEFFASEVERLVEKTKNMNPFDIMMLTEEPYEEVSEHCSDFQEGEEIEEVNVPHNATESDEETGDEWIPLGAGDGEYWVDRPFDGVRPNEDSDGTEHWDDFGGFVIRASDDESSEDENALNSPTLSDEVTTEFEFEELNELNFILGTLFVELPVLIVINYFEYV